MNNHNQSLQPTPSTKVPTTPTEGYMPQAMFNALFQNQAILYTNQATLNNQMSTMGNQFQQSINQLSIHRERKKAIDYYVTGSKTNGLIFVENYNDGTRKAVPLITYPCGSPTILKILYDSGRYEIILIEWKNEAMVALPMSILNPTTLYDSCIKAGIKFNHIPKKKIQQALYDWVCEENNACTQSITQSGYAGWEDRTFISAESVTCLQKYRYNILPLPVFKKSFDKNAINFARMENYKCYLRKIRNPEVRALFSLIPFSGLLYTWLSNWHIQVPIAINLIFMTEIVQPNDIAGYFQIFNREQIQTYSANMSWRKCQTIINESKDEVLIFTGMQDEILSNYFNRTIANNLEHLAANALGKNGITYGDRKLQSIMVLLSNAPVRQRNVKHLFIEDDFFTDDRNELEVISIQTVLACLVNYVETHSNELNVLVKQQPPSSLKTEYYWKTLIAVADDFWRNMAEVSLNKVLDLPSDFRYDFLWQEDVYAMENGWETVVMAVRKSMPDIPAVSRKNFTGIEEFLFDDNFLWIFPQLFQKILERSGLGRQREQLLVTCKEKGLLITDRGGRYITRIQGSNIRKGYYKFKRECFNRTGEPDIIDLAKED